MSTDAPPCAHCGAVIERLTRASQRFCSKKCAGQSRKIPERPCPSCGAMFSGRDKRLFCSRKCASAGRSLPAAAIGDDGRRLSGEKRCTKCGVVSPYERFSPHRLGIGGVRSICKPCSSLAVLARRATSPAGAEVSRRASRNYRQSVGGTAYRSTWNREWAKKNPERYMLSRAKCRAKAKGVPCTITVSDIKIPSVCPVLGIDLEIGESTFRGASTGGGKDNAPSLDRIVPSLGYVPGNVAVISWRANKLKNAATLGELEALVRWLRQVLRGVWVDGDPGQHHRGRAIPHVPHVQRAAVRDVR